VNDPRFGTTPVFSSEDPLDLAVSPDGQALTITYADFGALVDAAAPSEGATGFATIVTSLVLPVEGFDDSARVAVRVGGFAFVTEGAAGWVVVVVDGNAGVRRAAAGMDDEFLVEVTAIGSGNTECRISVILAAERDTQDPNAEARLNVLSLDAEITRAISGGETST
jgi:hypothetical protein